MSLTKVPGLIVLSKRLPLPDSVRMVAWCAGRGGRREAETRQSGGL